MLKSGILAVSQCTSYHQTNTSKQMACLQEMNHDCVTFISILVIHAYVREGQGSLGAHQAATL